MPAPAAPTSSWQGPLRIAAAIVVVGVLFVWLVKPIGNPCPDLGKLPPGSTAHSSPSFSPPGTRTCDYTAVGGIKATSKYVPWIDWILLLLVAGVAAGGARMLSPAGRGQRATREPRPAREPRPPRPERAPRAARAPKAEREPRAARPPKAEREPKAERAPRAARPPKPEREPRAARPAKAPRSQQAEPPSHGERDAAERERARRERAERARRDR